MKTKHIIIGGVVLASLSLMSFASAKTSQAKELFEKIIFWVSNIKRVRIEDSKIKFDIDITLENPTAQDFTASSAGTIKAKVYRVYYGNNPKPLVVGSLNNFYGFQIMAGSRFTFSDIPVEIPVMNAGNQLVDILTNGQGYGALFGLLNKDGLNQLSNRNWGEVVKKFRYEVDIEAFGLIYTYKNTIV